MIDDNIKKPKLTEAEKEALRRIKGSVEAGHWIKGQYTSYYEEGDEQPDEEFEWDFCLTGFVNREAGMPFYDWETESEYERQKTRTKRSRLLTALEYAIKKFSPRTKASCIEEFNDASNRTSKDILKVIDIALEDKNE